MKASRTLNWYSCLRSIVRVCCEMVKNNKAGFLLSFSNKGYSFILFISQKIMYKISLKLACDVDFGCLMKALPF